MASLGVVLPTRNAMRYLPAHLAEVRTWIHLADQVVVVDSASTDGTVDCIRRHLDHPRLRILDHPPGLYASWNAGIAALTTDWAYLSTIGDSMTADGLVHLHHAADSLGCDVLLSPPEIIDESGRTLPGESFAISDLIRDLEIRTPCRLATKDVILHTLTHLGEALTGSCASDLFRRAYWMEHPFPVEHGTSGDGYWCVREMCRAVWAVTPRCVSRFRRHPTFAPPSDITAARRASTLDDFARQTLDDWLRSGQTQDTADAWGPLLRRTLDAAMSFRRAKSDFDALRQAAWPWYLRPAAWIQRSRRNAAAVALRESAATARRMPPGPAPHRSESAASTGAAAPAIGS